MTKQVQIRRGSTSQHNSFTGASGEITVDTDLKTVRVHDNSLVGGHRLAKYSDLTTSNVAELNNLYYTNARAYANTLSAIKTGNGIVYDSTLGNITLSASGVTASVYGNSTIVPIITVDTFGRITSVSNATITASGTLTSVSGNGTVNGLTLTGTVTTSGNLTLGGTLTGDFGTGAINTTAQKNLIRFHWDTLAELQSEVSAVTYHGMIAHVHNEGRLYFAHAGAWVPVANQSDSNITLTSNSIFTSATSLSRIVNLGNTISYSNINVQFGAYFSANSIVNTTWGFTGTSTASNMAQGFILELYNGGNYTQTWPNSVRWPGNVTPALSPNLYDLLVFVTDNNGTSWRGSVQVGYTS
jgi:hypothetical protein